MFLFRHADVGPSVVAFAAVGSEVQALVSSITSLYAHAGGDCPEYALPAILETLRTDDPLFPGEPVMTYGSQIVVLTDAGTKNPELEAEIISEAQTRGVCIHFIFSPGCCCDTGRELYERIASSTGGIVIDTLSDANSMATLNEFVQYYEENPCAATIASKRRKRQAVADDGYSDEQMCHTFLVPSLTTLLKLVVNTVQSNVIVTKPSGSTTILTVVSEYASLFESNPEGGNWSACVNVGTLRYTVNAEIDIDVVVSYLVENSSLSNGVATTSAPPAACML